MGSTNFDLTHGNTHRRKHGNRSNPLVEWTSISTGVIRDAITAISHAGGAIRFGLTRDGGAYAIGVYGEGDPYTEYFHDPTECEDFLREISEDYGKPPVTQPK